MTKTELLLTILMEECAETAQIASKAIRFTLDEVQDGQDLTNAQRIVYEFNDIVAIVELMEDEGLLSQVIDPAAIALKKLKVRKWLSYSSQVGTLIT